MPEQDATIVDTGLPGRPNTGVTARRPGRVPDATGLPGFIATFHSSSVTPASPSAART